MTAHPSDAKGVALSRLRIRHLQVLETLARLGSLRRVAAELGLTQTATVSLIDDLEYAFGVPLVVRDHTGTTLTRAALPIVARARLAIEEVTMARDLALRAGEAGGRLRIGASPYLIGSLLPVMIAQLRQQIPSTQIEVREGTLDTLVDDLVKGDLDALMGSVDRATVLSSAVALETTYLIAEPMCVVAGKGHALFEGRPGSLREVLQGPWVLPPVTSHIRGLVDSAVFDTGSTPITPHIECRGIMNILGIAASAGMLTVAPQSEVGRKAWKGRAAIVTSPLSLKAPPYAFVNRLYAQQMPELLALRSCAFTVAKRMFGGLTQA